MATMPLPTDRELFFLLANTGETSIKTIVALHGVSRDVSELVTGHVMARAVHGLRLECVDSDRAMCGQYEFGRTMPKAVIPTVRKLAEAAMVGTVYDPPLLGDDAKANYAWYFLFVPFDFRDFSTALVTVEIADAALEVATTDWAPQRDRAYAFFWLRHHAFKVYNQRRFEAASSACAQAIRSARSQAAMVEAADFMNHLLTRVAVHPGFDETLVLTVASIILQDRETRGDRLMDLFVCAVRRLPAERVRDDDMFTTILNVLEFGFSFVAYASHFPYFATELFSVLGEANLSDEQRVRLLSNAIFCAIIEKKFCECGISKIYCLFEKLLVGSSSEVARTLIDRVLPLIVASLDGACAYDRHRDFYDFLPVLAKFAEGDQQAKEGLLRCLLDAPPMIAHYCLLDNVSSLISCGGDVAFVVRTAGANFSRHVAVFGKFIKALVTHVDAADANILRDLVLYVVNNSTQRLHSCCYAVNLLLQNEKTRALCCEALSILLSSNLTLAARTFGWIEDFSLLSDELRARFLACFRDAFVGSDFSAARSAASALAVACCRNSGAAYVMSVFEGDGQQFFSRVLQYLNDEAGTDQQSWRRDAQSVILGVLRSARNTSAAPRCTEIHCVALVASGLLPKIIAIITKFEHRFGEMLGEIAACPIIFEFVLPLFAERFAAEKSESPVECAIPLCSIDPVAGVEIAVRAGALEYALTNCPAHRSSTFESFYTLLAKHGDAAVRLKIAQKLDVVVQPFATKSNVTEFLRHLATDDANAYEVKKLIRQHGYSVPRAIKRDREQ